MSFESAEAYRKTRDSTHARLTNYAAAMVANFQNIGYRIDVRTSWAFRASNGEHIISVTFCGIPGCFDVWFVDDEDDPRTFYYDEQDPNPVETCWKWTSELLKNRRV